MTNPHRSYSLALTIVTLCLLSLSLFPGRPVAAQELFVSDFNNDRVLRYNGTTGAFVDVFASGGGLDAPANHTFGPDGNLYVSSDFNARVVRYNGASVH